MLGGGVDHEGQHRVPRAGTEAVALLVAVVQRGGVAVVAVRDQQPFLGQVRRGRARRRGTGHIRWRTPCSSSGLEPGVGRRPPRAGSRRVGRRGRRRCRRPATDGCGWPAAARAGPPRGRASPARAGAPCRPSPPAPSRRSVLARRAELEPSPSPVRGTSAARSPTSRRRSSDGSSARVRAPPRSHSVQELGRPGVAAAGVGGVRRALGEVEMHDAERARIEVLGATSVADNVVRRRRHTVEWTGDRSVEDESAERGEARHAPCIAASRRRPDRRVPATQRR